MLTEMKKVPRIEHCNRYLTPLEVIFYLDNYAIAKTWSKNLHVLQLYAVFERFRKRESAEYKRHLAIR